MPPARRCGDSANPGWIEIWQLNLREDTVRTRNSADSFCRGKRRGALFLLIWKVCTQKRYWAHTFKRRRQRVWGSACCLRSWQDVYRCSPEKKKRKIPDVLKARNIFLTPASICFGDRNEVGSSFSKENTKKKKKKSWCLCGEFTEGTWWEHSASIRSQSIIDGHVNILWGGAMEKMTLYSGTHTCRHTKTRRHRRQSDKSRHPSLSCGEKIRVIEGVFIQYSCTVLMDLSCGRALVFVVCEKAKHKQKHLVWKLKLVLDGIIFVLKAQCVTFPRGSIGMKWKKKTTHVYFYSDKVIKNK